MFHLTKHNIDIDAELCQGLAGYQRGDLMRPYKET